MSGGGSKTPKSQEVRNSSIPKFAEPYAMDMLGKGQWLTNQSYTPYQGDRLAGFNPQQNDAFTGIRNWQVSPQTGQATGLAGLAGNNAGQLFANGYSTGTFDTQQMGTPNDVTSARWNTPGMAQSYMSPYIENVIRAQQRDANRQSDIAGTKRGFQTATSGAYGGSRASLGDFEANRNLALQLGDIEAKGMQDAYTQGASQFNADEGRLLQAGMANQQAGLTAGEANLQARIEAQRMAEQSRQFGAGFSLDALRQQLASAEVLGGLGNDQYNQMLGIFGAQMDAGNQQQEFAQRQLDIPYQEFLNELNYPYKQLGWMSDLIHGLPSDQSSTIYGYPNTGAQNLAGLGGLASLYMSGKG